MKKIILTLIALSVVLIGMGFASAAPDVNHNNDSKVDFTYNNTENPFGPHNPWDKFGPDDPYSPFNPNPPSPFPPFNPYPQPC